MTNAKPTAYVADVSPRRAAIPNNWHVNASNTTGEPAEVAEGVYLPFSEVTADARFGDYNLRVGMRIIDRKPVCELFQVAAIPGGPKVSPTTLREIPLAAVLERMLTDLGFPYRLVDGEQISVPTPTVVEERASRQPRSTVLPQVVEAYRDAIARGSNSPTADVARQLNYARGYVSRLLSDARKAGMLGAARPGVSGEHHG